MSVGASERVSGKAGWWWAYGTMCGPVGIVSDIHRVDFADWSYLSTQNARTARRRVSSHCTAARSV